MMILTVLLISWRWHGTTAARQAAGCGHCYATDCIQRTAGYRKIPGCFAAAAAGYGIELDLQLTADGEVVVFHDDNLLRLCGIDRAGRLYLAGTAAVYLCESRERSLVCEGLPLLTDVPLLVELKTAA